MASEPEALLTAIWDILTEDATVQGYWSDGVVNLALNRAEVNDHYPFGVHRIDSYAGAAESDHVVRSAYYFLDWFDKSNSGKTVLDLYDRSITLLDLRSIDAEGTARGKLYLDTQGWVEEDTPMIKHYAMRFSLRYARGHEIENILNR